MQLLAVSHTGRASGAEAVLLRTLGHAAGRGWDVSCASGPGPLVGRLREAGIRHVPIPDLGLPGGPRPAALALLAGRTALAAARLRPAGAGAAIVLCNGLLALPALRLARLPAPVAWVVHDVVTRPDRLAILRLCAPVVDLALPVSEAAARPPADAGIPVRVIRNGTPWPVEPAPSAPPGPPVVGCSALLTSWKGQDVLLEAVAGLARPDVVLELMGGRFPKDGGYVAALEERAAREDLAGRVRFLGHVDDPLARMRTWTVAVSASVEPEAAPLALIEAMSLGVPVVGTDLGGTPEVGAEAGLLVGPRDAPALAEAIARMLDDSVLRARCGAAGRRKVGEELSLDGQLERTLAALDELARRPRPGRPSPGSVVYVVPDFEPEVGGTVRQAGTQARALLARGHSVAVLTRRLDRGWPRHDMLDGLPVTRVGGPGGGALPEKLSVLAVAAWLVRWRRRIAVVQVVMYADFVVAAAVARLLGATVLTWASRGDATDAVGPAPGVLRRLQRRLRRLALSRCAHVALSPSIAREVGGLGLGDEPEIIPVPVDHSRFRPPSAAEREAGRARLGVGPDDLVVVYTGHLRALKCVDRLVDAFGRFLATGRPGHLVVVGGSRGDADDREGELRASVREGGLDRHVTFAGVVDEVRPHLWAADVFVLPSSREGVSNALLEAMACGLACVAPASAGGDEVLAARSGVVPPSNRAEDLCAALVVLADDPDARRAFGAAAVAQAAAYGVDEVVSSYERLYARLHHPPRGHGNIVPRLRGVAGAGRALAGSRLRTRGAVVLAYHDVGDDSANSTDYYVSPAQLREQLTAAIRWGLRFVDLAELTDGLLAGRDVDGLASVVFDDSLVGVHHHALPVLAELGVPATVFAVSDGLGSSPPWWPGAARVMTPAELVETASLGFRIASHTRTHPSLPSLTPDRLADELAGSKAALEDLAGAPVELFAYPFGHHDPAVRDAVAEAGYRAGYSFLNGRLTPGLDPFRLPRLNMWAGQGRARLAYHLARPPASWPPTQMDTVLHQG